MHDLSLEYLTCDDHVVWWYYICALNGQMLNPSTYRHHSVTMRPVGW